jgi:pilus assembly protein Flp/PilA
MHKLFEIWRCLRRDEMGAAMVEYGLLAALISLVCVGAMSIIGTDLNTVFARAASKLASAS